MLAIASVLGGCFESQLFECGDDRVCPVGYACTPSYTCLSPAEVTACEGIADGEPCLIDGLDGTCREGGGPTSLRWRHRRRAPSHRWSTTPCAVAS